jgi:hypothetical protein
VVSFEYQFKVFGIVGSFDHHGEGVGIAVLPPMYKLNFLIQFLKFNSPSGMLWSVSTDILEVLEVHFLKAMTITRSFFV